VQGTRRRSRARRSSGVITAKVPLHRMVCAACAFQHLGARRTRRLAHFYGVCALPLANHNKGRARARARWRAGDAPLAL
jgi:hypothetical protein